MHMLKLDLAGHEGKRWCGPSAVALIANRPLVETTRKLGEITLTPAAKVSGVWHEEAILALHSYGYQCLPIDIAKRYPKLTYGPTLKTFMRDRVDPAERLNPLLISVHKHLLVGHFDMLFDNRTPKGEAYSRFPKPNRNVSGAWVVRPLAGS